MFNVSLLTIYKYCRIIPSECQTCISECVLSLHIRQLDKLWGAQWRNAFLPRKMST